MFSLRRSFFILMVGREDADADSVGGSDFGCASQVHYFVEGSGDSALAVAGAPVS